MVFSRAQAGLEYLMTYGWALVIIAAIIGALVLVLSAPEDIAFSSSDSSKILIKGSSVNNGSAAIKMQNITGGTIKITQASIPPGYSSCTIEGQDTIAISEINYIELKPGQEAIIECTIAASTAQPISLTYTEQTGLQQTVSIAPTSAPKPACQNGETKGCQLQSGVCAGALDTCTSGTWPGCSTATYLTRNPAYLEVETGAFGGACSDSKDNDCDTLVDCADQGCYCLDASSDCVSIGGIPISEVMDGGENDWIVYSMDPEAFSFASSCYGSCEGRQISFSTGQFQCQKFTITDVFDDGPNGSMARLAGFNYQEGPVGWQINLLYS